MSERISYYSQDSRTTLPKGQRKHYRRELAAARRSLSPKLQRTIEDEIEQARRKALQEKIERMKQAQLEIDQKRLVKLPTLILQIPEGSDEQFFLRYELGWLKLKYSNPDDRLSRYQEIGNLFTGLKEEQLERLENATKIGPDGKHTPKLINIRDSIIPPKKLAQYLPPSPNNKK